MRKNHAMIWMIGLGAGVLLAGLAYAFFAQFEHSSWFPSDLRRLFNREEMAIFGGGGVLATAGIVGALYASGAFLVGPATFATAHPPPHRYDPAGNIRLPISLVRQGRIAHGDVVLLRSGELAFVCLKDESAAAAAAGKAVANQFGLVGALAGAAVSAARSSGREEEMARLRHQSMQWPLEQQLAAHALNIRLHAQHLVEFHGGGWFTCDAPSYGRRAARRPLHRAARLARASGMARALRRRAARVRDGRAASASGSRQPRKNRSTMPTRSGGVSCIG